MGSSHFRSLAQDFQAEPGAARRVRIPVVVRALLIQGEIDEQQ
jgi:hypothetical protein